MAKRWYSPLSPELVAALAMTRELSMMHQEGVVRANRKLLLTHVTSQVAIHSTSGRCVADDLNSALIVRP